MRERASGCVCETGTGRVSMPFPRTPLGSSLRNSQHPLWVPGPAVGPEEVPSEALIPQVVGGGGDYVGCMRDIRFRGWRPHSSLGVLGAGNQDATRIPPGTPAAAPSQPDGCWDYSIRLPCPQGPSVSCHAPLPYFPPQALLPEACSHPLARASWFWTSGTLGDPEGN